MYVMSVAHLRLQFAFAFPISELGELRSGGDLPHGSRLLLTSVVTEIYRTVSSSSLAPW